MNRPGVHQENGHPDDVEIVHTGELELEGVNTEMSQYLFKVSKEAVNIGGGSVTHHGPVNWDWALAFTRFIYKKYIILHRR